MDSSARFLGWDIHKSYVLIAGTDSQQAIVLKPRKVSLSQLDAWMERNLQATDSVALEATGNAWTFYDRLQGRVARVSVVNPLKIKLISASRVKTDKQDAVVLAKLLAANLVPEVWVPPLPVRDLRQLVAHRQQLVRDRSAAKNRLQSIVLRHNLSLPSGCAFSQANAAWWQQLDVGEPEKLRIRHELRHLQHLTGLITEVEAEIAQRSVSPAWQEAAALLIPMRGIGVLSAMTILSAIGDITRFPTSGQLVGYAGLGASVHASGQTFQTGKITKQGRRELRKVLVEAAWVAVRYSAHWRAQYMALSQRMSKSKAITIIARKRLVVIWHVLTKRQADRTVEPQTAARSLMNWLTQYRLADCISMTRAQFVQHYLQRLGLVQGKSATGPGSAVPPPAH